MKQIQMNMDRFTKPTTKATSERASLIERFVKRLNVAREQGGFKPMPPSRIAMLMSHIATDELDFFYKQCDSGNNFSKLWWYYVRVKK